MRKGVGAASFMFSSGLARNGLPGSGIYSGSKAALHGLTRLFREQASNGILTNVVMVGATLTDNEISRITGKNKNNCRQLFRRAKQKVSGSPFEKTKQKKSESQKLLNQFLHACSTGDLDSLISLLEQTSFCTQMVAERWRLRFVR
jgi:NAD(P)-dependent dehydrogenase (short-subunit alcohol dehydrogenase family)